MKLDIASKTKVTELREGKISRYVISPEDFGFELQRSLDELKVNSPEESLSMAKKVCTEHSAASSMVVLNAGAALYVSGMENSLSQGVKKAKEGIKNKAGLDKLKN